jgi:hypothetical protein
MKSEFREDEKRSQGTLAYFSGTYAHAYGMSNWERIAGTDSRQLQGIDVLVTTTGAIIPVEEKAFCLEPTRQYPDVAIELLHEYSDGRQTPGWIYKPQQSQIFAMAWPFQKVAFLLDTQEFLAWFLGNERRLVQGRVWPHTDRHSGKQSYCLFIHRNVFIEELQGKLTVVGRWKNKEVFVLDGLSYLQGIANGR